MSRDPYSLPDEEDDDEANEAEARENPCSQIARAYGCTCSMESVNSASIDPPEPIIDPWCPLHGGRDADREYDAMRDERGSA